MNLIKNLTVITLAAAMGYGCSSSSTPPATPNGIYTGTLTGGIGAPFNGGEKGIIYNDRFIVFSTPFGIQQIFDATLTVTDTSFTALVDNYNNISTKIYTADLSGTFIANTSVNATVTNLPDGTGSTDSTIILNADTTLYNRGSNNATVAGSWQGVIGGSLSSITTTLSIDATGTITSGSDSEGCNLTGSVIPADTSVNVYNATLISTGCNSLSPATYTGLAWTEGDTNGTLNLSVSNGTQGRTVILTKN